MQDTHPKGDTKNRTCRAAVDSEQQSKRLDGTSEGSIGHFMKHATALAAEVNNVENAWAHCKRKRDSFEKDKPENRGGSGSGRAGHEKKKKTQSNNGTPSSKNVQSKERAERTWDIPCLNPKCKEKHRIKDCKMTNAEEAKKLLSEHFSKQKIGRASVVKVDGGETEGRYVAKLAEKIDAIALGDSGADFSAIRQSVFERLVTENADMEVSTFEKELMLSTAIRTTKELPIKFSAKKTEKMSIVLQLPRTNLPLLLHGVEFLVIEQDMDELLLGRPFLKRIGFELDQNLSQVREDINGVNISDTHDGKLGGTAYSGIRYDDNDDPVETPEHLKVGFGNDYPGEITSALQSMISNAERFGMSSKGLQRSSELLQEFRGIIGIKLGTDPPAKLEPLHIRFVSNARPMRCPQRRYAPNQRAFINHTINELENIGAAYKNNDARWASPALAVPKPGTEKLHFTVDLQGPNSKTESVQSSMPHLEAKLVEFSGSTVFANLDLCHGYWKIPLAKESQEILTIRTPIGLYSPTSMLQGGPIP